MSDWYILDRNNKPVRCDDPSVASRWVKALPTDEQTGCGKRVAYDANEEAYVSTVFLGLDHNYRDSGPILFETMVFGGEGDGECVRYATWDEAVEGHKQMVKQYL